MLIGGYFASGGSIFSWRWWVSITVAVTLYVPFRLAGVPAYSQLLARFNEFFHELNCCGRIVQCVQGNPDGFSLVAVGSS
jgi:hypothetical protein